jgi:hypothetical protein
MSIRSIPPSLRRSINRRFTATFGHTTEVLDVSFYLMAENSTFWLALAHARAHGPVGASTALVNALFSEVSQRLCLERRKQDDECKIDDAVTDMDDVDDLHHLLAAAEDDEDDVPDLEPTEDHGLPG